MKKKWITATMHHKVEVENKREKQQEKEEKEARKINT
jgi:hypothetical protein